MNNPFKNNSLASALMGYILGAVTVLGVSPFITNGTSYSSNDHQQVGFFSGNTTNQNSNKKDTNPPFHGLEENPDGDVLITKSGKCYHSLYGCSSLKSNSKTRTVSRDEAENVGLTACSKCNP